MALAPWEGEIELDETCKHRTTRLVQPTLLFLAAHCAHKSCLPRWGGVRKRRGGGRGKGRKECWDVG